MGRTFVKALATLTVLTVGVGCSKKAEQTSVVTPKTLYVASGLCNPGTAITGYTPATASRTISKISSENGAHQGIFMDFNATSMSTGTVPNAMIDMGDTMYMLTENATNMSERRILAVPKNDVLNYRTYFNDVGAFNAVAGNILRGMALDADGSIVVSKSIAAEKISSSKVRLPQGANPWVNAPAGNCATSTTFVSAVATMLPYTGQNQGKIIFAHQGATAALNRIAVISSNGYSVAGDCIAGVQPTAVPHTLGASIPAGAPTALAATGSTITSMIYVPQAAGSAVTGKLITAYSASVAAQINNNTSFNHGVVVWDVTESGANTAGTVTINNPVILYNDWTVLFGISAMTYDESTGHLFVATGAEPGVLNQSTNNRGFNIEKFNLNLAANTMVRIGTTPFMPGNTYTKCISAMSLGY